MEILKVKQQGNGWKVNDSSYVADIEGASYRDEVLKFIVNGGAIEPQFTDLELLSQAKSAKITSIDSQTALDIEALVGDSYKQLEKTIEHQILVRMKVDGEIVDDARIAELELLSNQVLSLKYNGNTREDTVALVELVTTLESALAEIEAI